MPKIQLGHICIYAPFFRIFGKPCLTKKSVDLLKSFSIKKLDRIQERENIIETLEEIKKDEKYEKTFYLITEIVETPLFRKVITISQEDNESFSREKIS